MGGKNQSTFDKILKKVTHQSDQSPPGLKKYQLVIVGAHMGGILTRHFEKFDHGHTTTYVAFDSPMNLQQFLRPFYETQEVVDSQYFLSPKVSMANYVATSDGLGVTAIHPERNTIQLENGNEIEYEQLVLSLGLKDNFDDIKGFREAWEDDYCPVYTTQNSSKWTTNHNKQTRFIGNYTHGDAYFYIPKYPFRGEIAAYHFLQAHDYWEYYRKIGKISPLSSLTVVNANDTFSQFDKEAHEFILKECEKRGIKVLFNTELTEVNGKDQTLCLKGPEGQTETKEFNNLYVIPRGVIPPVIKESGLADKTGFLDVDPVTLQAKNFDNIYGLGDINNLPVTKSFWSAFHQMHAIRQNLLRAFKGQEPNAPYSGYSKVPFYTGSESMTYFEKDRTGSKFWNLAGTTNKFLAGKIFGHAKGVARKASKIHMGKEQGPPFGKTIPFGKYYKGKPISRSDSVRYTPETKH